MFEASALPLSRCMETRTLKNRQPCQGETSREEKPPHIDFTDRQQHLEYLSQMLAEMRKIALNIEENTLAYLIEMSVLEALQAGEIIKFQDDLENGVCGVEDSL